MSSPPVSVLVPFRNSAAWFSRALDSLEKQSLEDFQVVLVNNGSSDGSVETAEERALRDSRFVVIHSGGTLVDALNKGLRFSTGKWIARFDSDDICHRHRLSLQLSMAEERGERTVVSCRVRCFPQGLVSTGYRNYERWINSLCRWDEIDREFFVESPIPHPTAFYSRRAVLDAGGYRDLGLPEDYELWLRLRNMGFTFVKVPRVLLGWRESPGRFSRNSSAYSLSSFYRLKAIYLRKLPMMRSGRICVAGTGQCARRLSGHLIREGFSVECFLSPHASPVKLELRGRPVISMEHWKHDPRVPVVAASRAPGAGKAISVYLESIGLRPMKEYVLCS